jgi:hypothetical protein
MSQLATGGVCTRIDNGAPAPGAPSAAGYARRQYENQCISICLEELSA